VADEQEDTREDEAEGGGDTAENKEAKSEEGQEPAGSTDDDGPSGEEKDPDDMDASEKAQKEEEEREEAKETMKKLEEEGAPDDLEDWPTDKAKYETFGGPEGEHSYHEGPEEEQLGPSSLRHHEDGNVTIAGKDVDDPDEYKSSPIPGGPTDEDSNDPSAGGETDDDEEDSDDGDSDDSKEEAEAETEAS
jgi:hypothetical protein